jgi:Ca-activated chloride channel family protein
MKFVHPGWLWTLLVLPFVLIYFYAQIERRKRQLEAFAHSAAWSRIAPELDLRAKFRKGCIFTCAAAFAILALARPQWGKREESVKVSGLDIVIALDVSNSMEVEDIAPNRLKKAKFSVRSMLDQIQGDRVGVVAFASSAYVACPLTTDVDYVRDVIETLSTRSILNQGTDIGVALDTAVKSMERGAEEQDQKDRPSAGSRVVVLISDGEDFENQAETAAKRIKDTGVRFYVLGVGTEKGGPIPTRDESGQLHGFKRSRKGEAVVSTFNPAALKKLSEIGGGRYWTITNAGGEMSELVADLGSLARGELAERKFVVYEERFYWPLLISILLLFLEISISSRKSVSRPQSSQAVRSLGLFFLFGSFMFLFGRSSDVLASELEIYQQTRDGVQAFQEGRMPEAKRNFGNAQAQDPDRAELKHNQGVIQFQEGDFESAASGFEGAAKRAIQEGDQAQASRSLRGLGDSLAKLKKEPEAIKSYLQAIERAKQAKNQELVDEARKNLEILYQEKQKQKEQQKNQDQKQDQKESKDQKDQKDSKDQQKQDQEQKKKEEEKKKEEQKKKESGEQDQKSQQYDDPSQGKREFKSQKLSKDAAQRVMDELSSKERELQNRLRKQKGQPQENEKDW